MGKSCAYSLKALPCVILMAVLLATRDGAVLGQKASETGLIDAKVFEPNKYDKNKVRDELGISRSAVCYSFAF